MTSGISDVSESVSSANEYKEYFEKNNLKGNNYETAKFIKFLTEKRTKGKEIEQLTGLKHSQITSYKKIIKSGEMENLKDKSINKVLKLIDTKLKLDERVISEFEKGTPDKFILGEDSDDELYELFDSDEDEIEAWEEEMKKLTLEKSNGFTADTNYLLTELVDENKILRRKITKDGERQLEATRTIEEQQKTIEDLQKENASLLVYKKFFEEMKGKMDSLTL